MRFPCLLIGLLLPLAALAQSSADPRTGALKAMMDRAAHDGAVSHAKAESVKCRLEYGGETCSAPRANMASSKSQGNSAQRQARARRQSRAD